MWWRGLILILIIGVTNFTVMDCAEAYDEESSTKYNVDIQRECLDEILIFEIRLKIMSVLEGEVMTQDSNSDIVQITFKANTDGYKASDFRVIRRENNNLPLR
jgi:endo-beta-N-acetylglucosaminidase D